MHIISSVHTQLEPRLFLQNMQSLGIFPSTRKNSFLNCLPPIQNSKSSIAIVPLTILADKTAPPVLSREIPILQKQKEYIWRIFLHEGIWLDENIQSPYVTIEWSSSDCHHSHICHTTSKPLLLSYVWSDMIGWITSSYIVILFSFLLYGKGNFIPSSTKTKNYFCFVFVFVVRKGWP